MNALDNQPPDRELATLIQDGDQKAYYLLFDRYWELMYRIAQSLLRDEEQSKDIVQDIWLSYWERRADIVNDNIRAYLIQSVKFSVYKAWRDGKFTQDIDDYLTQLKVSETPDDFINYAEMKDQIHEWIDELPEKRRAVFTMSRYDNKSNKEIASELDLSQRTVETHISHALKYLRHKMKLLSALAAMFLNNGL